jgi:hypothetical protein
VGDATTTVEVTDEAPLIETTQAQITNTFSGTALTNFAGIQENQGLDNLAKRKQPQSEQSDFLPESQWIDGATTVQR